MTREFEVVFRQPQGWRSELAVMHCEKFRVQVDVLLIESEAFGEAFDRQRQRSRPPNHPIYSSEVLR